MVVTTMLVVSLCVAGKRMLWHAADEEPNVPGHLPKHFAADTTVRGRPNKRAHPSMLASR